MAVVVEEEKKTKLYLLLDWHRCLRGLRLEDLGAVPAV